MKKGLHNQRRKDTPKLPTVTDDILLDDKYINYARE